MTEREEFDLWCGYNGQTPTVSKLHVWQAAKATAPAWHDAPTVPGLWLTIDGRHASAAVIPKHELSLYQKTTTRWYGPIPEDKP